MNEDKYLNEKVVCIHSSKASFTVGKIYNCKSGAFKDDKGVFIHKSYSLQRAKSIKDLNYILTNLEPPEVVFTLLKEENNNDI